MRRRRPWTHFFSLIAPALRAAGWQIDCPKDFRHRLLEPTDWHVDILDADDEGAGSGWFEVSLGVEVDGRRLDLAPMLHAVFHQDPRWLDRKLIDAIPDDARIIIQLEDGEREAARELIEYGLLYEDALKGEARRLSVDADLLVQQFATQGASTDLLKKLENTFLLRREVNTLGGYNYELSHDTLIAPVLKAKAEREAEKERLNAERRAQEAEAKAREEALRAAELQTLKERAEKNARRASVVATVAVVLALLAVVASLWSLSSLTRAW